METKWMIPEMNSIYVQFVLPIDADRPVLSLR